MNLTAGFHRTDFDVCSYSREKKIPFYGQINTEISCADCFSDTSVQAWRKSTIQFKRYPR